MREMSLIPKGTSYKYKKYIMKNRGEERPNLLNQVFLTDTKNKIWIGDITYIPTSKGTIYLAVFLDLFTRKVVGWSVGNRMKDSLVIEVFRRGYGKEHPVNGLIIHTDQGAQYTSGNFRSVLSKYGAIHGNSRKGNLYDNAMMKAFYRTIKRELIQGSNFANHEQAQHEVFKYTELYYNSKRMHSSLGYLSPAQFED